MSNDNQLLKKRAKHTAQIKQDSTKGGTGIILVEFLLFPEKYAVEASYVREVLTLREITHIPGTPEHVMGVVNFRGTIISVINLKILFGLKEKGLTEMNKILLLRKDQMEFGLVADAIIGSTSINKDQLSEPPQILSTTAADFVSGLMNNGTILLDANRMLTSKILLIDQ